MADPAFDIPPPPPGFTLDALPVGGPVFGAPPKPQDPQAKTVSNGFVIDPNSATAAPVAGLPRPHVLSDAEVAANHLDPSQSWQMDASGDFKKIGDAPTPGTPSEKTQAAMDSTRNLIQSIERARGLVSNWSTGLGGAVGKLYPGSDQAKQLDSVVHQELRGNIFQNWVNGLKATSAMGTSGIGRIMQSEIPLVTGALGALDPVAMGRDQTLNSFDQIEHRVLRSAALLNHENPDDPAVLDKYSKMFHTGAAAPGATPPSAGGGGSGGTDGSGGGSGGDSPPGLGNLDPGQSQAYSAFLAANPKPTGDQVGAFLSKLTGKQVTNGDAIAAAIAKGQGVSTTTQDLTEQQKVRDRMAAEDKAGVADNPATTLLMHGATANLSDEAAGVGNAAANVLTSPFTGHFDPIGEYRLGRDVERQRIADAQQQLGWAGTGLELAGGAATLAPTNALAAVTDIPAMIRTGAKGGGAIGVLSGFGAGQGAGPSLTGAAVGGIGGAALGAAAPYAVGKIAPNNALARFAPDTPDVVKAAQAEGVDLLRPMVDPAAKGKFGALESSPGGQNTIRAGVDRVRGQIEDRVTNLAPGGTAMEPGAAGEKLQLSGNRYIQRSRGIKDRLYKAAENAGGDTRLVPQDAIDQADQHISELSSNPQTNAGEIKFLQGIRDDLAAPGGKTVADIRNIRTGLRGALDNNNLTMSGAEARANSILSAAGNDISAAVPEAGRLYKRADSFYRERQTVVDDIKRSILGQKNNPLDPQTAFQNIKTLAAPGGNLRRLSAVTSYLEPDERADVAATVASTLGRASQDAPFTTDKLLQQTDKMSPAAMRTIFGPDGAQSISNLRLLSQKLKEGVGDINRSKTANGLLRQMATKFVGSLTGLGGMAGLAEGGVAGGGTGAMTGLAVGGAVQGAQMVRNALSARAMVSPKFTQWLVNVADVSTPSQAKNAVRGLTLVISREPAIATELAPIRDFLDQRVTQLLAADPNDQQNQQAR